MSDSFKLISLNVRGISNFQKRRMIFTWCRKKCADIIFLQETHSKKETELQWKSEWGSEIMQSHGSCNSRGVAILLKRGVDFSVQSKILDPMGRFIILKADIADTTYVLINIYARNKDKEIVIFFKDLTAVLKKENLDTEENVIVGGDFNCPINPFIDKKGGLLTPRKMVVDSIKCFQDNFDLIDIWRVKNPGVKSFTWSQKSPRIFCRLDYWLISNNLQDLVISTDICPAIKTDHAAIIIEVGLKDNQVKGPGLWKMNCAILEEESYINEITQKIPIWVHEGQKELADNRTTWEWIKYNIRAHAIQFSKRRAKEKSDKEKCLQNEYTLATKLYESDPCDANANLCHAAKEKLELFYEEKTKGIIIRARARWYEHVEKSTKYFLNLEKRNHIKKHMLKLNINESVRTDPLTILSEQKLFYQNLYMSGRNEADNRKAAKSFLNNLNIPKLSEEEKRHARVKFS